MKISAILVIVAVLLIAFFVFGKGKVTGNTAMDDLTKIKFETTEGNFVLELYDDMLVTTENFEKLVSQGFYDGVLFHRIIDGFMLQTGDPLTKDKSKSYLWGTGGSGYNIKDEFTHEGGNKNSRGTISMANAGPNTGGSQFFINTVDNNFLDTKHPAFGEVIEGMDVIDSISKVETDSNDRPIKEVKIIKVSLV